MTKFYSHYNKYPTIPAPQCFKDTPAYELRRDPNCFDEMRLVEKPTRIPIYDIIQESKGPDVKQIVNRAMLGDYSLIGQTKATFQDFTKAPRSLREVQELIHSTAVDFEKLPVTFKVAFNNNVDYFRTCVQDGTVDGIVQNVVSRISKPKAEPVVKEVNINEPQSK